MVNCSREEMAEISAVDGSAPVIRIWAPQEGDAVMEKLAALGTLEAIFQNNGVGEVDIMPPRAHGRASFPDVFEAVMYTGDIASLGSKAAHAIQQALLDGPDIYCTFGHFPNEASRDAHAKEHALTLIFRHREAK